MESPLAVSNYFIQKSFDSGYEVTPMKLIKLVYISHGYYLALTGLALIPEQVEAWQYGPVVKTVYQETKVFGKNQITSLFFDSETLSYPLPTDKIITDFLDRIWVAYGKLNGLQLSGLTHQDNTPWDITYNKLKQLYISDDLIKTHYKAKLITQ